MGTQLLLKPADKYLEGEPVIVMRLIDRNGLIVLFFCVLTAVPARAGVFESIHPVTAKPVRWATPKAIPYSIDEGSLGQLNHDQAVDLVEAMMGVWENEGGGAVHFVNQGSLGADVTTTNLKEYVDTSVCTDTLPPKIQSMIKGQSPIIFDTDGSIIDALAGPGASQKIVGKAAFRCFKGTLEDPQGVTQAFLIMNGRFIDGQPDPVDLPLNVYTGVILHEIGHYLGLHHSMVNEEVYMDVLTGERPAADSKYVPVMYPLILTNSVASTVLKPDDVAILQSLYPVSDESRSKVSGEVITSEGFPAGGANVIARRIDDPLCQAISAISGRECTPMITAMHNPSVLSESCGSPALMGDYTLHGLVPGQYTLEVNEIVSQSGARDNMFPKGGGQDLPGEPMMLPNPLDVSAVELNNINFRLSPVAAAHITGIDESIFLKSDTSECITDPVNYKELVATSGPLPADSSSSQSAPPASPSAPVSGGCSLIR